MIRPEQIPDEVVEAAARASAEHLGINWDDAGQFIKDGWREDALITIAAALNAWPGAFHHPAHGDETACLFLPLAPQEPRDDR